MIAADTNIVVRLIADDNPHQRRVVEGRLGEGLFISHSVLMETEWVLRTVYRLDRGEIHQALLALLEWEDVHVPLTSFVFWALDRYAAGADWADMLHLISARTSSAFITFDRDLARDAGPNAPLAIELLR